MFYFTTDCVNRVFDYSVIIMLICKLGLCLLCQIGKVINLFSVQLRIHFTLVKMEGAIMEPWKHFPAKTIGGVSTWNDHYHFYSCWFYA